jgi:hypothetical protein
VDQTTEVLIWLITQHILLSAQITLIYIFINFINMTVKHNNNILNLVTGCLYVSSFRLHVSVNFYDHHHPIAFQEKLCCM